MAPESPGETLPAVAAPPGELLPATTTTPRMSGGRKAAVLMAALGSARAANVMQRLAENEIESLSIEMAGLDAVGPETTESVFTELATLSGAEMGASGGMEFARGVIELALGPERAAELLGRLAAHTRSGPVRVPAARPPRAHRRAAAQRVAADDRADPRERADGARGAGAGAAAGATAARYRAADRAHG